MSFGVMGLVKMLEMLTTHLLHLKFQVGVAGLLPIVFAATKCLVTYWLAFEKGKGHDLLVLCGCGCVVLVTWWSLGIEYLLPPSDTYEVLVYTHHGCSVFYLKC